MISKLNRYALLLAVVSSPLGAQGPTTFPVTYADSNCLRSIPDSAMTRVAVFLTAQMVGSTPQRLPPSAANLLQAIADRVAILTGANTPVLPRGEPAITWKSLDHALLVTWFRDGHLTWKVARDTAPRGADHEAGIRLVGRALAAADSAGEVFMVWPDSVQADSLMFAIELVHDQVDHTGKHTPLPAVPALPIFSVAVPWMEGPVQLKPPRMSYPVLPEQHSVIGTAILEFVVDTNGRADVATVRDIWPPDKPRLTGQMKSYYDQFINAARRGLRSAAYSPGRIGGCPVGMVVVQPFDWKLR